MVGTEIRIFVAKRTSCHQVHAVGHCVGQNRGVPGVAGSEECGQVVIVGQICLIVVPHGARAVGIELRRDVVSGIEKSLHEERAVSKRGRGRPG